MCLPVWMYTAARPNTHQEMLKDVLACTQIHNMYRHMCFTEACPHFTYASWALKLFSSHFLIKKQKRRQKNYSDFSDCRFLRGRRGGKEGRVYF